MIERTYPAPVAAVWHALSDNDARVGLGLVDELELHIVPVILGDGMRLLSPELGVGDRDGIELAPARVIATPEVTHIRYRVRGRSPLVLDNRGRDDEPAVA